LGKTDPFLVPKRNLRVRRNYSQWVANQTIEDFSLRFTAKKARKWSELRVGNTALGSISFLALESIGGSITLQYGFVNTSLAIVAVCVLIFMTGLPIAYYAAKHGVDIDLLSRGAGFGYIGSTITSLIYASFTFIFFAIEAAIMAAGLQMFFGVPLFVGYLFSSLIIIPIVIHGVTLISQLQLWTQPLWVFLHILPFAFIIAKQPELFSEWTLYTGQLGAPDGGFDIILFGAASAVLFSLSAQIGEQVDFLRFLKPKTEATKIQWWIALLSAGPGWIIVGGLKIFAGSFLAFIAVKLMHPTDLAVDPSHMYKIAFEFVFSTPGLVTLSAATFVIISQIKINVTNAYAGSIAWSNFFSRLTHSHPGRVVWLVFNVSIAFLLISMGVYRGLEQILGMYSIIAVAWVGALSADLLINKPFGLSPKGIEFRRAYLYDINPVGIGSLVIAVVAAALSYAGIFGEAIKALSSYVALAFAFCSAPIIAYLTSGEYYIARTPDVFGDGITEERCCLCESHFEVEDMAICPLYDGPICSLCCSLDSRCHDACKEQSRYSDQIMALLSAILPTWLNARVNSSVAHFLGLQLIITLIIVTVLSLIYYHVTFLQPAHQEIILLTLTQVFAVIFIISGVATWLFVLARESASLAQEESSRQTFRLSQEVAAHTVTDAKLEKAREVAEAANAAKSRFVVSLNHEFRTPLNAILGYSQIIERDEKTPDHQASAVSVIRRSSEHLGDLIDGLLNVSQIEAEHFVLDINEVWLSDFFLQINKIFELETSSKGINLLYSETASLPVATYLDEKRLRQICINLLSNAVKFTTEGWVKLHVDYADGCLQISITDTGIGIADADKDRIFEPFERASHATGVSFDGSGLGLAITKLLVERMSGIIALKSNPEKGSTFKISLPAKTVAKPKRPPVLVDRIVAYSGPRCTVIVTDDNAVHCELIVTILMPLGFNVVTAKNAAECLQITTLITPDLYLLDIEMPGQNGLELASILRSEIKSSAKIVMVSANAKGGDTLASSAHLYDGYILKPVEFQTLVKVLQNTLGLSWEYEHNTVPKPAATRTEIPTNSSLPLAYFNDLVRLGRMGHVRGILEKLNNFEHDHPEFHLIISELRSLAKALQLRQFMDALGKLEASYDK
jgi:signal transduction histidine kinase/CheY-like chemotaxis protein